jgi:hypothetical protein
VGLATLKNTSADGGVLWIEGAEIEESQRARDRYEPELWAVRRDRGLERVTKSGVRFLYLRLRVAP